MKKLFFASFLFLFTNFSFAKKQMISLPINNLSAVEEGGQIMFVSNDGRYIIRGELFSVLYKKSLSSMDEIYDAVTKIDFKKASVDTRTLSGYSFGSGNAVTIFIDPLCTHCLEVVNDAKKLKTKYQFRFIIVPALGEESNELSQRFFCSLNKDEAFSAMQEGKLRQIDIKQKCDLSAYDQTLLIAQLMGIRGVPYIVSPSGQIFNGRPKNLESWLLSVN